MSEWNVDLSRTRINGEIVSDYSCFITGAVMTNETIPNPSRPTEPQKFIIGKVDSGIIELIPVEDERSRMYAKAWDKRHLK